MRVIVAGPRDWPEKGEPRDTVWQALSGLADQDNLTVVHGDCPTGVDAIAQRWIEASQQARDVTVERYPAEWNKFGRMAGPFRNKKNGRKRRRPLPPIPLPGPGMDPGYRQHAQVRRTGRNRGRRSRNRRRLARLRCNSVSDVLSEIANLSVRGLLNRA